MGWYTALRIESIAGVATLETDVDDRESVAAAVDELEFSTPAIAHSTSANYCRQEYCCSNIVTRHTLNRGNGPLESWTIELGPPFMSQPTVRAQRVCDNME